MIKKYRKKPLVIDAIQYTEETRQEVINFCGAQHMSIDDDGAEYELLNLRLKTMEGTMMVKLGDWVIRGISGEFYPCNESVFAVSYEPAKAKS